MERQGACVSFVPQYILQLILGLLEDTRHRNVASLVCKTWYQAERQTRISFVLRGHVLDLLKVPLCFNYVTNLDLSKIAPWGSSFLKAGLCIEEVLAKAFPMCVRLSIYAREVVDMEMIAKLWPRLEEVRLVRWHERSITDGTAMVESELSSFMNSCPKLRLLDLSNFFCWADDIPPILSATGTANNLRVLDLPKLSPDGLTNSRLMEIAACCPNLEEFRAICKFDSQYEDCVRDSGLQAMGTGCSRLRSLALVDLMEQNRPRLQGTTGITRESLISPIGLHCLFSELRRLRDLSLLLGHHVPASVSALVNLPEACPNLVRLELGCFQQLSGGPGAASWLRMCPSLRSLSLRKCHDMVLEELVGREGGDPPPRLQSLTLQSCRHLSPSAITSTVTRLSPYLSSVCITDCPELTCWDILIALKPIRGTLKKLCLNVSLRAVEGRRQKDGGTKVGDRHGSSSQGRLPDLQQIPETNSRRGWNGDQLISTIADSAGGLSGSGEGSGGSSAGAKNLHAEGREGEGSMAAASHWPELEDLTLCMELGVQLDEVVPVCFELCPRLSHVTIKAESDRTIVQGPTTSATFGLNCLRTLPSVHHLTLKIRSITGYGQTVPVPGFASASLGVWEKYFLLGIEELSLTTVEYWPPTDRNTGQSTLFMTGSGILSMCHHLRKLTVHASVTQHVLSILQRAKNLRDVQVQPDSCLAPLEGQSADGLRSFQLSIDKRVVRGLIPD